MAAWNEKEKQKIGAYVERTLLSKLDPVQAALNVESEPGISSSQIIKVLDGSVRDNLVPLMNKIVLKATNIDLKTDAGKKMMREKIADVQPLTPEEKTWRADYLTKSPTAPKPERAAKPAASPDGFYMPPRTEHFSYLDRHAQRGLRKLLAQRLKDEGPEGPVQMKVRIEFGINADQLQRLLEAPNWAAADPLISIHAKYVHGVPMEDVALALCTGFGLPLRDHERIKAMAEGAKAGEWAQWRPNQADAGAQMAAEAAAEAAVVSDTEVAVTEVVTAAPPKKRARRRS